jgi:prepilin-type N-terminal cleavage/methylation domain-containing protein
MNRGFTLLEFMVVVFLSTLLLLFNIQSLGQHLGFHLKSVEQTDITMRTHEAYEVLIGIAESIGSIQIQTSSSLSSEQNQEIELIRTTPIVFVDSSSHYSGPVSKQTDMTELVLNQMTSHGCTGSYVKNLPSRNHHYVNHWYLEQQTLKCRTFAGRALYFAEEINVNSRSASFIDNVYDFQVYAAIVSDINEVQNIRWVTLSEVADTEQVILLKFALVLRFDDANQFEEVTLYARQI